MFQVVVMWNLSRPDQEMADNVQNIELRGNNPKAFLTGEFATKLAGRAIRPLSVSNIADRYCPTRRDLYFIKGINRLKRIQRLTWGQKAGNIVENYIEEFIKKGNNRGKGVYSGLRKKGERLYKDFNTSQSNHIRKLKDLEKTAYGTIKGDTEWLLSLLNNNGRAELGLKLLHSFVKEGNSLGFGNIKMNKKIRPKPGQIGISAPAIPDFIIPDFGIVGDIKTGIEFKSHFQVSCAGYALAYENQFGKNNHIDWGIIYFFPTRNPTAIVKPLTFAQIYIFPLDDNLRRWFIQWRDEAYNIISKTKPPEFPPKDGRAHCPYCGFKDYCISQGLELAL